ncbi:hypothetical protein LEP1GSC062_4218 [Leptospira alexanderi serovar Manhao 3 str. L 60]|uniref:Uncharacterized protein n=1 Tax=Leptospira alexanderi serovar Manhao 3 str. L 60 TaxID=1049759 RepID=V6HZM4_9LEPT|nr:hypothetical protein LEP1GSC062_4218 [Leptospira alexanderi serovar Manhao 3 str. L 60]
MTPVILWLNDLRNRIAILRAGIEVVPHKVLRSRFRNQWIGDLQK